MSEPRAHFGDAIIERVRRRGHPLCVGLDPHLSRLPQPFLVGSMALADPKTAPAVSEFCRAVLDRVAERAAVVKPQIALFEQLGPAGMVALAEVLAHARQLGVPIIMDAKRGDIGSTADGYANAYLAPSGAFASDALTVNAYMGLDTLAPYVEAAQTHGRGMFVLVKTSNPGSATLQDQKLAHGPVYAHLARALADTAETLRGPASGWSSLGVVVGATYPEQALVVREQLPHALFLVPGYGAQGGRARDAVASFVKGPNGREGGLVNSSRAILFPKGDCSDRRAWERALDQALDRATTELGEAVAIG